MKFELTPNKIKKIRKKLNLTQKQASFLCGGGINAFSRYETGLVKASRSTTNLLYVLSKNPEGISYLLDLYKKPKGTKYATR
jgi:HTH-type transcriptional regulator/antitoxin MqsA